jgi:hypothetical protein
VTLAKAPRYSAKRSKNRSQAAFVGTWTISRPALSPADTAGPMHSILRIRISACRLAARYEERRLLMLRSIGMSMRTGDSRRAGF